MCVWSIYGEGGKDTQWVKTVSSVLEKLDRYIQKHKTGLLAYTIDKNKFKMD